jgi:hypothetical protein
VDAFRAFHKKIVCFYLGVNIGTTKKCLKIYNKSELTCLGLIDYECRRLLGIDETIDTIDKNGPIERIGRIKDRKVRFLADHQTQVEHS